MAIDKKLIEQLEERRKVIKAAGGDAKVEKRHAKGQLSARERIEVFFDKGTFKEFGMHVIHDCHAFLHYLKCYPRHGYDCDHQHSYAVMYERIHLLTARQWQMITSTESSYPFALWIA